MTSKRIRGTLEDVRETLRVPEEARADDRVLYEKSMFMHYPDSIRAIDGDIWIRATGHDIPSYDSVLRARRIVQNVQKMYMPPLEVALARGIEEKDWREAMNSLPLWI